MTEDFMAAMRRSLDSVRGGDPMGATRTIQAALNGAEADAPRPPAADASRPTDGIEDAEIVEAPHGAPRGTARGKARGKVGRCAFGHCKAELPVGFR